MSRSGVTMFFFFGKEVEQKPVYVCKICELKFSRTCFEHHMTRHSREKPYMCKECKIPLTDKIDIRLHIVKHSEEKTHKCTTCSKTFKTSYTLEKHLKIHVTIIEKPYKCEICGMGIKTVNSLRKHTKRHSTNRCKSCGIKFRHRKSLDNHLPDCKITCKASPGKYSEHSKNHENSKEEEQMK